MSIDDPMRVNALVWADDAIRDLEPEADDLSDTGRDASKVFDALVQLRAAYVLVATDLKALRSAVGEVVDVFGDGMFAIQNGEHFTCNEAEIMADLLLAVGEVEAANVWLSGHAEGDDEGDSHYQGEQPGDGDSEGLTGRDG